MKIRFFSLWLAFFICWCNLCQAGWVRPKSSAELILSAIYVSQKHSALDFQLLTNSPKANADIKTSILHYQIFCEYGIGKKTSITGNIFASQFESQIIDKTTNKTTNYKDSVPNFFEISLRRKILSGDYFSFAFQTSVRKSGNYKREYDYIFGHPEKQYEQRMLFGIGTQEAFINNLSYRGVPFKVFFIYEVASRRREYYRFSEFRTDYTLGYQLPQMQTMLMLQRFVIFDTLNMGYKQQAVTRDVFSLVTFLSQNIKLQTGVGKEISGYRSNSANSVHLSLWINY